MVTSPLSAWGGPFSKLRTLARFRNTPGLQALDVVLTLENTILQSKVAAQVLSRIADCNDIPPFQLFRRLRLAADVAEHTLKEVLPALSDQFGLTEAERNELLPSGQEKVFRNRASWANTYLKKAGPLRSERRGYFSITQRGKNVLAQNST